MTQGNAPAGRRRYITLHGGRCLRPKLRVYGEILRRAKPDEAVAGQWIVRPYPPEREIASRAGTTRETVARAVGQLRQAGLVLRKDRNLYLKDRDKVIELAEKYRALSGG